MKRTIIVFALTLSCASQAPVTPKQQRSAPEVSSAPVQPPDLGLAPDQEDIPPTFGELLKNVSVSETSFNPSRKESVGISYELSGPAESVVKVYDCDLGLIRAFRSEGPLKAGTHTVAWDGLDLDGKVVPDEAYFFTVEADAGDGNREIYDPTEFSGGVEHDIAKATVDPQTFNIHYAMPEMGRVMIRMGIHGGPLMNQLVDWKPRVKGAITEYWDGKDKDRLVDLHGSPGFKMIIAYFTLPENSVIAYGNRDMRYRQYKSSVADGRPRKEGSVVWRQGLSPHYELSRTVDYVPGVSLEFEGQKGTDDGGLPILHEKAVVRVALAEQDKAVFQNSQFEICFYLDSKFYAEDESGYTPFNWVWDLGDVEEGGHLLTVNISSFRDQIGVVGRKVRVVK